MTAPTREELEHLSFAELKDLAAELEEENQEIQRIRRLFVQEFWNRVSTREPMADDLAEGEMVGVEIGGRQVLLARVNGEIRAIENVCPHRQFPLHRGSIDGYTVTCSYHGGQFDLRTGECVKHPTITVPSESFRVEVLSDGSLVCASERFQT